MFKYNYFHYHIESVSSVDKKTLAAFFTPSCPMCKPHLKVYYPVGYIFNFPIKASSSIFKLLIQYNQLMLNVICII